MSGLVLLGKNITIDTTKPLAQYDNGPAKAYAAMDATRARGKNLIAYICDPHYVARRGAIANYKGMTMPAVLFYVSSGVCDWPLTRDQRFVIVYEHSSFEPVVPYGRLMPDAPWKDSEILEFFVKPMAGVLNELGAREFFHGSIRLSNIFFGLPNRNGAVVLGDGLSVPPSSTQSNLYEPVERALAHPLARGEGTIKDDVYAFGVCFALLLRGDPELAKMTEDQIIEQKIQHGTYMLLLGKERLSGHIIEILRGCLQDNPDLRWKPEDILNWLDGRRMTPPHSFKNKKAIRPFEFAGQKYHYTRDLAYAMSKNTVQAQTIIESGEIADWLERSVGDSEALERVRGFLGRDMGKSKTRGNGGILVSAIICALDPAFPVFYKDIGYFPEGLGNYFAHAVKSGEDTSDIAELIVMGAFLNHLFVQPKGKNVGLMIKILESCKLSLSQTSIGHGIERCLYILCRDAMCLSSRLTNYFITGAEDMMMAFEEICSRKQLSGGIFLDRHSIAFLSIHEGHLIDGRLFDLNSKIKHQLILTNMKTLAAMQKRMKNNTIFPNITRVLSESVGELLVRFHDKELRKAVELELQRAAKLGNISEIVDIIDNPVLKNKDRSDFRRAMREYAALREEYRLLEAGIKNPELFGRQASQNFAVVISWGFSILIIATMVLFHVSGMKG